MQRYGNEIREARTDRGMALDSEFEDRLPTLTFKGAPIQWDQRARHWEWDRNDDTLHPCTLGRWAEMFENRIYRVVGLTTLHAWGRRKCTVSTIFLGTDHGFGPGPPVLFETLVDSGPLGQEMDRYCSVQDARLGHRTYAWLAQLALWIWPFAFKRWRGACLSTCVAIFNCLQRCGLLSSYASRRPSPDDSF